MKFIFPLLLIFSYSSQFCMRTTTCRARPKPTRPQHAMPLAAHIAKQRKNIIPAQHDLLHKLKNVNPCAFKPAHVGPITDALTHKNAALLIDAHKDTIARSIKHFINTPGFFPSLQRLFAHASHNAIHFQSSLYELEQALEIKESDTDERVTGINQFISCPEDIIKKEFDVHTTHGLIECKNIIWPSCPAFAHHLRAQFEQQHKIVELLNAHNEKELYFRICSKERIPNSWRQWFDDRGISYSR